MRSAWALADRRLLKMELAFHRKAMDEMDHQAAVIALKSNERRASLQGGGSAQPSHLIFTMNAKAIEAAPTSTRRLRNSLDSLLGITHQERELLWPSISASNTASRSGIALFQYLADIAATMRNQLMLVIETSRIGPMKLSARFHKSAVVRGNII